MKSTTKLGLSAMTLGAITVAGFGFSNVGLVGAQTDSNTPVIQQDGHAPAFDPQAREADLVTAIATKFNLDKTQVQQVFDDQRAAEQKKRQEQFTARLDAQVTAGKITVEQKNLLVAKIQEMETQRKALKDITDASERRTKEKAIRDDFQKWLKDNKIPDIGFMGEGMRGHGKKMWGAKPGRGMGRGMHNGQSENTSAQQ